MSEIHGATGSYVLNALDPSELDEFEAHLAVCPTCSQEVVEFCETAAELSLLASATPPPALKGSVMAAITGVRVLPPEAAEAGPEPSVAPVAAQAAPVDELALRRQQRRARILSLAVAAVTVVALSLGGWVFSLVQQQQAQVAASNLETQLYSAPDVVIKPVTLPNGAKGSFVASKGLNRAMFTSSDLPSPGADRAYQLWTLTGTPQAPTRVVPDNTLSGGTAVKQFFRGDIAGSTLVAISNEPAGGSQAPTTTPTVVQL
jgi:2-keto-3-deoxy-6-phosphogluconate aldolase